MFGGAPFDAGKQEKLDEALKLFDGLLEGQSWAAGPSMTIADLSLAASIASLEAVGCSVSKYPNIQTWYFKVQKEAPGYEVNASGAENFKQLYLSLTSKK